MSGRSRIIVRPSASFCHWPPESSLPFAHVRPSGVSRPSGSVATTSAACARSSASSTTGVASRFGRSPTPTVSRASTSIRAKSWKPAVRLSRHVGELEAADVLAVERDRAARSARRSGRSASRASSCRRRSRRRARRPRRRAAAGRRSRRIGSARARIRERDVLEREPVPDRVRAPGGRARASARWRAAAPRSQFSPSTARIIDCIWFVSRTMRRRLDRDLRREDRREQHARRPTACRRSPPARRATSAPT